jgi:hypothetical protein
VGTSCDDELWYWVVIVSCVNGSWGLRAEEIWVMKMSYENELWEWGMRMSYDNELLAWVVTMSCENELW